MNDDSQSTLPLFRKEALAVQKNQWLGDIVFARPLSFQFMATFAVSAIVAVAAVAYFGTYTKENTVIGQIEPENGVIKLYPAQAGTIVESRVTEGQSVKKGDILFIVSSDTKTSRGDSQAAISADAEARKVLLAKQMTLTGDLLARDRSADQQKIDNYRKEIENIDATVALQKNRVAVAEDMASRYRQLLASQYVSEADLDAKKADLLDQQSRLAELQRDRTATERDLQAVQADLSDLPLKSNTAIAGIEGQLNNADEDLSSSESKREFEVVAPEDGTATAIIVKSGQLVDPSRSLITILPKNAKMQAILYATGKDIGFVKIGDSVELRYEPYPYQRYGLYPGTIVAISRSPVNANELVGIGSVLDQRSDPEDRGAPLYRIAVALGSQSVSGYGRREPLQAGILVEADILQDTHRVYEWVLDPLYALDMPDYGGAGAGK